MPPQEDDSPGHTELATIDGVTYVSITDGVALPQQPLEIANSVELVVMTPILSATIKSASPHCRLIQERMVAKIRDQYTIDEELFFARIGIGVALSMYEPEGTEMQELTMFGEHVEAVRQWGRTEREKLGLLP